MYCFLWTWAPSPFLLLSVVSTQCPLGTAIEGALPILDMPLACVQADCPHVRLLQMLLLFKQCVPAHPPPPPLQWRRAGFIATRDIIERWLSGHIFCFRLAKHWQPLKDEVTGKSSWRKERWRAVGKGRAGCLKRDSWNGLSFGDSQRKTVRLLSNLLTHHALPLLVLWQVVCAG